MLTSLRFWCICNKNCRCRLTIADNLKIEKNVYYSENKHNVPSHPKNDWSTGRDKHTKKLESNNYAGVLPRKVFIASQGHWKKIRKYFFFATAGNVKFGMTQ